jgi:hypothetical protein
MIVKDAPEMEHPIAQTVLDRPSSDRMVFAKLLVMMAITSPKMMTEL